MAKRIHDHTLGNTKSPTYYSWLAMKQRCLNQNHEHYDRYGGRGITVCSEWLDSFPAFLRDMGERPEGMTLDRIDRDGNYCPENCRWVKHVDQCRNRRSNVMVEFHGETMCLTDACRLAGVKYMTTRKRMRRGWSFERAISEPVKSAA